MPDARAPQDRQHGELDQRLRPRRHGSMGDRNRAYRDPLGTCGRCDLGPLRAAGRKGLVAGVPLRHALREQAGGAERALGLPEQMTGPVWRGIRFSGYDPGAGPSSGDPAGQFRRTKRPSRGRPDITCMVREVAVSPALSISPNVQDRPAKAKAHRQHRIRAIVLGAGKATAHRRQDRGKPWTAGSTMWLTNRQSWESPGWNTLPTILAVTDRVPKSTAMHRGRISQ